MKIPSLPHKETQPLVTLSLNLFNTENTHVNVKQVYCEQFYLQNSSLKTQIFMFIPVETISLI